MNHRKLFELGGFVAALVLIAFGAVTISGRSAVQARPVAAS